MDVFPKKLQILYIDHVNAITNTTLKTLAQQDGLTLRFLSMTWCGQISEEGVIALIEKNDSVEMNLKATQCKKKFQRDLVQNVDIVI